jgi:hypothetical protein
LKNKPKTKQRMKGRTARFTTRAGLAAGSMRRTHDLQTTIERANQERKNLETNPRANTKLSKKEEGPKAAY